LSYYITCPHCGANLDRGEECECRIQQEAEPEKENREKNKKPA